MRIKRLNKDEIKTKNIVLITTSLLTLIIGLLFFFEKYITYINGVEIFYITMFLYFGLEFANYFLTREVTKMHSLYKSLACIIASFAGISYMNEPTNLVLSITLIGWLVIMLIIKLIRIEELRNENNYSVFVNMFTMSLFILLGFLTVTNIYKGITNECLMLGFFFTVNGVLNVIETLGNIKFCK